MAFRCYLPQAVANQSVERTPLALTLIINQTLRQIMRRNDI